jgi:hypothetical protein
LHLRPVSRVGQRRIVEALKLDTVEILVGFKRLEGRARDPLIPGRLTAAGADQIADRGAGRDLPHRG